MKIDADRLDIMDKEIALYGTGGKTGRSVIEILSALGCSLYLYDDRELAELEGSLKTLDLDRDNITWVENKENLLAAEVIITSPGVSLHKEILCRAENRGILIVSEIELAYNFFDRYLIAITGTNGKTTTTSLTGEILSRGLESRQVVTAGNIGKPLVKAMADSREDAIIVAEVSSFQLAGIKNFRPEVAALLNFAPDHLDWHKNIENYRQAKKNIFVNQTEEDTALIDNESQEVREMAAVSRGREIKIGTSSKTCDIVVDGDIFLRSEGLNGENIKLVEGSSMQMRGSHNLKNIAFSAAIAREFNVSGETMEEVIRDFSPPPHRMQVVYSDDDILVIDDSKATNPHAARSALSSLTEDRKKVIIAGGQDRGVNLQPFAEAISSRTYGAVLLGEIADELEGELRAVDFQRFSSVGDMKEAVEESLAMIAGEGIIILAPGAPSWDMYDSYRERGRIFQQHVQDFLAQ